MWLPLSNWRDVSPLSKSGWRRGERGKGQLPCSDYKTYKVLENISKKKRSICQGFFWPLSANLMTSWEASVEITVMHGTNRGKLKYRTGITMKQIDRLAILWGHTSKLFEYFLAHLFSVSLNQTTDLDVSVQN